jgi:SAM-dependent methyltransferase
MTVDFTPTGPDYASRPAFPSELYRRLRGFGAGLPGQIVLDVGAGTGLFARGLAESGCRVVLTDASVSLLGASEARDCSAARAERLPFGDASFDVVTAAQSWHWFDRNVAPREVFRVLRPEGKVVAAYQMHVPTPGSIAERTERLILRHNPSWRHANSAGINGQVLRDFQAGGFVGIESFSFDVMHAFTRQAWRATVRSLSAVGASMPSERVAAFDREHAQMLDGEVEPPRILHRVFAAVATKPRFAL